MGPSDSFTAADYHFIAATLAGSRDEQEHLLAAARFNPDLVDRLLDDARLVQRLLADEEEVLKVSPRLLFTLLLRQVRRDLHQQRYTLERLTAERIPVFDARAAGSVLDDRLVADYLVDLLVSFVRRESVTILRRRRGRLERRRLSTLSLDDMIELLAHVEEAHRFPHYKRIGDLALFTSGMFGDYLEQRASRRAPAPAWIEAGRTRGVADYEAAGRRFYRLAAAHATARALRLDRVLERLAEEFLLVRKPLAVMADRYMIWTHLSWSMGEAT